MEVSELEKIKQQRLHKFAAMWGKYLPSWESDDSAYLCLLAAGMTWRYTNDTSYLQQLQQLDLKVLLQNAASVIQESGLRKTAEDIAAEIEEAGFTRTQEEPLDFLIHSRDEFEAAMSAMRYLILKSLPPLNEETGLLGVIRKEEAVLRAAALYLDTVDDILLPYQPEVQVIAARYSQHVEALHPEHKESWVMEWWFWPELAKLIYPHDPVETAMSMSAACKKALAEVTAQQ